MTVTLKTTLKTTLAHAIKQAFATGIHTSYEEVAEAVIKALAIGHPSEISEKFITLRKLVDELPNYDGITIRALSHGFAQETLDLISKLLAEGLSKTGSDGISATLVPVIHATFETSDPPKMEGKVKMAGITGSTNAPIKRVDVNDDGSYTVVIDYWPKSEVIKYYNMPDDPMLALGLALKNALPKDLGPGWHNLSAKIRNDGVDFYVTNLAVVPHVEMKRTDLATRMRTLAAQPAYAAVKTILTQGADEIDRYYTGMCNWKATAEAKDRKLVADIRSLDRPIKELTMAWERHHGGPQVLKKVRIQKREALEKAILALFQPAPGLKELTTEEKAALRDKRMSEMSPGEQDDALALELWLRDQFECFPEQHRDHVRFLLDRLSKTRREALSMKSVYADLQGVKESVNVVQAERQKLQEQLDITTLERDAYRGQSENRLKEIQALRKTRDDLEKTNHELRNERNQAMAESRDANHQLSIFQGSMELDGLEWKREGDGSITIINHDHLKAEKELEDLKNEFHTVMQERDELKSKMMMFPAIDMEYFTDLLLAAAKHDDVAIGQVKAGKLLSIIRHNYRGPVVPRKDTIMKTVAEVTAYINQNRDKLLMAWLAENEANPSDVVMVTQIEWSTGKEICWFEHKDKHRG